MSPNVFFRKKGKNSNTNLYQTVLKYNNMIKQYKKIKHIKSNLGVSSDLKHFGITPKMSWLRVNKTFFMVNLTEHKISTAHTN